MDAAEREPVAQRRKVLWAALLLLVLALLATLVWLAGRYEASQVQTRLERDAADAVGDVRAALMRNVQSLQALQFNEPTTDRWALEAATLLRGHRELLRIEWRASNRQLRAQVDTPFRAPVFERLERSTQEADVAQTCAVAQRLSGPAYSNSYFVPLADGLGLEVVDMCLPMLAAGRVIGYQVASYSLVDILGELVGRQLTRGRDVSFTEGDGTRLAMRGGVERAGRAFAAQQVLDLPGVALVLRMDSWRGAPALLPNVLTALVLALALALAVVLVLLGKDTRRRLKAERGLAEALAFRKAMEDSLVTGLRARDLQGRITYVNPAFCQMVGFSAEELLGQSVNAPYWPPELAEEYQHRQAIRMAGNAPPREGFESVFMHQDGTRFPVLIIEAPLIDARGVQTGWMSAFLDVREQRRIEDLSRASQERLQATARLAMVGEMASLLSHELNQPLAAIASYATGSLNLLREGAHSTADIELAMQRVAQQAERAGKVIKSVHDFVRRRDQSREAVTPRELVDAVMPLVQLQARKLGVRVQLQIEPDLPPVLCDRTMVEQVLLNLARNGMQAMDQPTIRHRVLTLQVQRQPGQERRWLEFSVADLGLGMAPNVEQQLFTPFFTTKAEGMGLGLSLCRTVIEQHGGELRFAAQVSQGTVFSFTLPVSEPDTITPCNL